MAARSADLLCDGIAAGSIEIDEPDYGCRAARDAARSPVPARVRLR